MTCLDTQDWSLTGLIEAFLNLFIAYLLLNMYVTLKPKSYEDKQKKRVDAINI